jgi:hypothetical protein
LSVPGFFINQGRNEMFIKPTVGRVVWFWEAGHHTDAQPMAALVTFVHSDREVNLVVFTHEGYPTPCECVYLRQDGEERPSESFAEWMPYQIGQAKKHAEPEIDAAARASMLDITT